MTDWADEIEAKIAAEYASHGAILAADADGMIASALRKAKADGFMESARICDEQILLFSSNEYSIGQPHSSFSERFACGQIKSKILAASVASQIEKGK